MFGLIIVIGLGVLIWATAKEAKNMPTSCEKHQWVVRFEGKSGELICKACGKMPGDK